MNDVSFFVINYHKEGLSAFNENKIAMAIIRYLFFHIYNFFHRENFNQRLKEHNFLLDYHPDGVEFNL